MEDVESGGQMSEPAGAGVRESFVSGSATTLEKRACVHQARADE